MPGLIASYVVFFLVVNALRWKVMLAFVDIDGIVDFHCSNFIFIAC